MKDFNSSYKWQKRQDKLNNSLISKTKSPGKTLVAGMLFEINLGKKFKGEEGLDDILRIFYEFLDSCFFDDFDLLSKTIASKVGELSINIWRFSSIFNNEPCCVVLSKNTLGIFISNFYIKLKNLKSNEIILKSDCFRSRKFLIKRARRIYINSSIDIEQEDSTVFLTTSFRGNRRYLKDILERMEKE